MDRSNRREMLESKEFLFDEDLRRRRRSCWIQFSPILDVESSVDLEELDERVIVGEEGESNARLVGEEESKERSRMWSRPKGAEAKEESVDDGIDENPDSLVLSILLRDSKNPSRDVDPSLQTFRPLHQPPRPPLSYQSPPTTPLR